MDTAIELSQVEAFLDGRDDLFYAEALVLGDYTIEKRAGLPDHNAYEVMYGTGHHGLFQWLPDAVWAICRDNAELRLEDLRVK